MPTGSYDTLIIGGGPAGLSAALVLGRSTRRVLLCDSGSYRNGYSSEMHCFLGSDGVDPARLRDTAREQLRRYPSITYVGAEVMDVSGGEGTFKAILSNGTELTTRTVLMATGVQDELPNIAGIREFWGRSIHVCPYCDGWECRDVPVAVYGKGTKGAGLALMLSLWNNNLTLCTDGPAELTDEQRSRLNESKIAVKEARIRGLTGENGDLRAVQFADETQISAAAMFFNTGQHQRSHLFKTLGCGFDEEGCIDRDEYGLTSVPNVYVAGDASRDVQLAIVAAAEGATAAVAINKALLRAGGLLVG